jgi:hypothetical protein
MLTTIAVIIGIIWVIVEESKEKPSDFYLGLKEFSHSPEGQQFSRNYRNAKNSKKIAKTRKKQRKRQRRQIRNAIIARQCIKEYNNFVFGNNRRK